MRALSQQALKCKYIGEYRYNDIVHPNGMPSIVSKDLFNRVQERMAATKKPLYVAYHNLIAVIKVAIATIASITRYAISKAVGFCFCQRTLLETVLITFSLFCSLFFKFCC